MIKIPKHVEKLKPYQAGKPIDELFREYGLEKIVKLASNENPLGPSPKAMDAIKKHITEIHRYTNPAAFDLVNAIAKKINKLPGQIVTGNGSDSLLQYIVTAFSEEEDELLTSKGSFIGWYVNVNKYGRISKQVEQKNYRFDLDKIADSITEKTKIIYLANPNNPTGTIFTKQDFENFLLKVPDNILIVLDEAYTVYAESNPNYPNGLKYDNKNLIVLRTLSKAYGLAGIRMGFAVGHEDLIKILYKVKLPFEPNSLAQAAAIAALNDDEFLQQTVALNKKSLNRFKKKFDELSIMYLSTSANFLLLLFADEDYTIKFNEECLKKGLILRHVKSFGIPNGIRINSGTVDETEFAINVISQVQNQ
ncbi:MAG TPA: histidinol-phosphate transaminase, partial [Ignavibacteria bacterium]|nr:histidinol-phosphate transaminase [Ignavibacteria bacterium]